MRITKLGQPKRQWKKHVIKEGARYHVVRWDGVWRGGRIVAKRSCSELTCEINKGETVNGAI